MNSRLAAALEKGPGFAARVLMLTEPALTMAIVLGLEKDAAFKSFLFFVLNLNTGLGPDVVLGMH